jgi:hypothetical protein
MTFTRVSNACDGVLLLDCNRAYETNFQTSCRTNESGPGIRYIQTFAAAAGARMEHLGRKQRYHAGLTSQCRWGQ